MKFNVQSSDSASPIEIERAIDLVRSGILDDRGAPRYERAVAEEMVAAGMPVAALTPLELARWVGEHIR